MPCPKHFHLTPPDEFMFGPPTLPVVFDSGDEPGLIVTLGSSGENTQCWRRNSATHRTVYPGAECSNQYDYMFIFTSDGRILQWDQDADEMYVLRGDQTGGSLFFIPERDLFVAPSGASSDWKPFYQWSYDTETLRLVSMQDSKYCIGRLHTLYQVSVDECQCQNLDSYNSGFGFKVDI
ncbi:expressed unknown protein [Seminavis robusta]|uniref:Uncharacterized protein n=1 Tax=Seminavis robusta TaxID=568900 RepID=A0A9N8HWY9_9STRA|nr:expressed unknown protein [Seminavis robusta]|eukprot:Sro1720_g293480.1 n/a (179) ;mRNA; r:17340-17876